MKRLVDVFGEQAPGWLAARLAKAAPGLAGLPCEYLTARQLRQLGTFPRLDEGGLGNLAGSPFLLVRPSTSASLVAAVCLVHGRACCFVSLTRGDSEGHVDPDAPFLSSRGLALTNEAEALERLNEVQKAKGYDSPFWLSNSDYRHYSSHTYFTGRLGFRFLDSTMSAGLFKSDVSVEVVNDRGCTCRVVNLEEVVGIPFTEKLSRRSFNVFRQFTPLNVRTGKPFEHSVEDHLRLECITKGLWCSVWGTFQDFEACSIKPLEGALGLYLMDSMGNEVFLTNPFCTEDPLGAFSRVYPDKFIVFIE